MIYLTKGQTLFENPGMVVYDPTGYYDDGMSITCAAGFAPDDPVCKYEAKFIAYGGIVYSISDPDKLMEEVKKIDPDTLFGKDSQQVAVDKIVKNIVPQTSEEVVSDTASTTPEVVLPSQNETATSTPSTISNPTQTATTTPPSVLLPPDLTSTTTPTINISSTTPAVDISTTTSQIDISTTAPTVDISTSTPPVSASSTVDTVLNIVNDIAENTSSTTERVIDTAVSSTTP
jgi:hypothetical protein